MPKRTRSTMAPTHGRKSKTTVPFHRFPLRPYPVVALSGHSAGHTNPATFPSRLPTLATLHTPCHRPTARPRENVSLSQTRSTTRLDDRRTEDTLCRAHPAASHGERRSNRTRSHPSSRVSKRTRARGRVPSFANRWSGLVRGICRDGFNETCVVLVEPVCCSPTRMLLSCAVSTAVIPLIFFYCNCDASHSCNLPTYLPTDRPDLT